MAGTNSFDSNITRKLIRVFLEHFESNRVLSKNVDTQLLAGKFDPASGDTVDFKRPTDYRTRRSQTGDIKTGAPGSAIITGKASGIVQQYFTVDMDFSEADQAIKMDQLDQLLAPAARRIAVDMETDFAAFMLKNAGLRQGTPGTAVTTWSQIANADALMSSMGVPEDNMWIYAINPFTQVSLADQIRSMGAGGTAGGPIKTALEKAVITDDFGGFRVMKANTLGTFTTPAGADKAGTLSAAPDATYVTAKDTMTQSLAITGFTTTLTIKAGETVTIANVNRLNMSTRKIALDASGNKIPWTGTVTADVTLVSTAGTIIVTGPAISETDGQFDTVDAAPANGAVITITNAQSKTFQPNMFWHKQAFGIGSVPMERLFATDQFGETEDGLQIRVSKFSDGLANKQIVRFDLRPAYAVFNPFFAGQGYGG